MAVRWSNGRWSSARLQTLGELFLREHPIGTDLAGRNELAVRGHVLIERHLVGAMPPAPEAVPVARLVDRRSGRSRCEGIDCPRNRLNGAEDAQKDFLREVERFVAIAQQVDRQLNDHPLMFGDELGAGGLLARCAPLHERCFADANFRPP